MRLALIVAAGCSFEPGTLPSSGGGDGGNNDALARDGSTDGRTVDAMADAMLDAPHTCAGYVAVAAAQTGSTYRKVNALTLWTTAKADCESDQAHLVIPDTQTEAQAIFQFVSPGGNSPFYWAGISDPERDNVWTTVLGQTFANPPWANMQPNQRMGEIYVLVASNGDFYDWYDNGAQEYACECEP